MSGLADDLVTAWAENAALKQQIKDLRTALGILCQSNKNWQELASELEMRIVRLGLATLEFMSVWPESELSRELRRVVDETTSPIVPY